MSVTALAAHGVGKLATACLDGALPCALYDTARPLVGTTSVFAISREQYFANQPALFLGLLAEGNDWDYPL